MRISHKYKFVFISKPKCATTSVRKVLDQYSDIHSTDSYPYHHHSNAQELKWHFEEMNWEWDQYYKFITIRNPWDMVVSWYHYAKPDSKGNYWYQKNCYDENNLMSFRDWVISGKKTFHKYYHNENGGNCK